MIQKTIATEVLYVFRLESLALACTVTRSTPLKRLVYHTPNQMEVEAIEEIQLPAILSVQFG